MNNLQNKKDIVLKYSLLLNSYKSILIFNIDNISSNKINNLRKKLKLLEVKTLFIKKTLLFKSFLNNDLINLNNIYIFGQNIIILFNIDPIIIIKLITLFINENNYGKIKLFYYNKIIYLEEKIEFLNSLLPHKEIIIKFIFIIKNISIQKLVKVLYYLINN